MIQFNLLPDVKLEYIRAQRRKRLVTVTSSAVMAGSLALLILLFVVVQVIQKQHLAALTKDINQYAAELQGTEDLDKILTVQNQLMSLTALHDQKPVATRLYAYLKQVTPTDVSIAKIDVDFELKTMRVTGSSGSLSSINTFVDTLKFTSFTTTDNDITSEESKAFSNVVLSSFGRSAEEATYTVDLTYDEAIFDSSKNVRLTVPNTITTRSETERPLFEALPEEEVQDAE